MTTPYITELADGVYAYIQPDGSWYLNNTGFLTASNGVVSIDASSTERRTRAYLEAIRAVSDRPVRTLVNTHHHGDHTYARGWRRAAPRWRPRVRPTSARTLRSPTRNGWSETSIAPTTS